MDRCLPLLPRLRFGLVCRTAQLQKANALAAIRQAGWLCLALGVSVCNAAQPGVPQTPDPPGRQTVRLSADTLPEPPDDVAELLKIANVRWEFYDLRRVRLEYLAITNFEVKLDQQHRFQYQIVPRGLDRLLQVRVRFGKVEPLLASRIQAPDSLSASRFWESSLIRHELDHLRVAAHPFVLTELRKQVLSIRWLERLLQPGEAIDADTVSDWVAREIRQRVQAMNELVKYNNLRLDQLSAHGGQPFDGRRFAAALYTPENLRSAEYPYAPSR